VAGRTTWFQGQGGHMKRRRAAVTGGAGFLGSHLCDRLLGEGYEVICLDDFSTGNASNVEHLLERDGFRLVRADVTAFVHISGELDAVLHFASPASPIDYLQMPLHTLKVGSIGTFHALGLAREKKARFLLASTSESYGDPLVHPQPESYWGNVNPVGPRGVYDEAKRFSEALTMAYRNSHGINTAIVRIFNTFGPRMRPGDGRAIPTFIRQALAGQPLTVAGDGSQTRSVCYVDDLVEGIVRLLHSDLAGPMNIGNPREFTILELAELIRDLTASSSAIEFVPRPQDDPTVRQPDITFARTALSWEPVVDVKEGLLRTIDWFRQQADLRELSGAGSRHLGQ
jgi:dTDP-glucose 4,6-dehydratase